MNKISKYCSLLMPSILGLILMLISNAFAESIDHMKLLKISPQDERAVVKTEDGGMKIIKPGDAIGKNGRVIEITANRVVIEEQTENGRETVIMRLVHGNQTVERISRVPDGRPQMLKPQ